MGVPLRGFYSILGSTRGSPLVGDTHMGEAYEAKHVVLILCDLLGTVSCFGFRA